MCIITFDNIYNWNKFFYSNQYINSLLELRMNLLDLYIAVNL